MSWLKTWQASWSSPKWMSMPTPTTPGKYGVRGIPTLLIFKDGEVSAMKVGALPAQALNEWVTSSI